MHSSTRDLWFEITKLFREGNSLIIYHLHKRISLIGQDNAFVLVHFFKLKILWDGLRSIETLSPCIYGFYKAITKSIIKINSYKAYGFEWHF